MTARIDPRARDMTEAELSRLVVGAAVQLGWKVYGIGRSDKSRLLHPSAIGYPDLTMHRPGMVIYAELKTHRGKVEPEQQEWLDLLAGTFTQVYVWRPQHWLDGSIIEILRSRETLRQGETLPAEPPPTAPLVA